MIRATGVLTVALALGTAGCSLQTIGAPQGGLELSASFNDVQSLVVGHSVQLSDVRIGTVTGIRLTGYSAMVTMELGGDRRLPTGTTATIARTSLLGENYVRLDLPRGRDLRHGPFLADGARIGQTSVQPDLEQISERIGPLLAALGGQNLETITDESATAVHGKGRQLNTLIKRAAEVTDSYAAASADLGRALESLAKLGDSLADGQQQLDRLPGNVALATQRLKNERAQLKRGVVELTKLARSVNANIQLRHAKRLETVLRRADALIDAAVRGRQDLKALAANVLKFLNGPSTSYSGQGLLFIWLKGFLPAAGGNGGGSQGDTLGDLLEPRS